MQFPLFCPAELLIPEAGLLPRWSVVACDQFTSEPEYWNAVAALTADVPSAYHITLPEIYLNDRLEERIRSIEETMLCYQQEHIFRVFPHALVYIERRLSSVGDLSAPSISKPMITPLLLLPRSGRRSKRC